MSQVNLWGNVSEVSRSSFIMNLKKLHTHPMAFAFRKEFRKRPSHVTT